MLQISSGKGRRTLLGSSLVLSLLAAAQAIAPVMVPVGTTANDFTLPGSQPGSMADNLLEAQNCQGCHEDAGAFGDGHYAHWKGSMMAQATRDPIFWAALAIANQDAPEAGTYCMRCHTPGGFLEGHATPADGSGLQPFGIDQDGVSCSICHRMVDPVYTAGVSPIEDVAVLAGLSLAPGADAHTGQYVIDPDDQRRGPYGLDDNIHLHGTLASPFHQESRLCANCHDVSNPVYDAQPGGTYDVNTMNAPHATFSKTDMFPVERTFSEWEQSVFAIAPQDVGGRFGGTLTEVASCQDCHMPTVESLACAFGLTSRPDINEHTFLGANSWVIKAVQDLFPFDAGISSSEADAAVARNVAFLQEAADLSAWADGGNLHVRVVNRTGHKLPTGYGEGRRMWISIDWKDAFGQTIQKNGGYNAATATLNTANTTVYEIKHGLDANVASLTGNAAGESFHFVLNNTIEKDNRIPPQGYNGVNFDAVQAPVVGATYADNQHWDDTTFPIPIFASSAVVRLYHQTTSKEYIEFLLNENTTNTNGQTAYDQWLLHGKSAPVEMEITTVALDTTACTPPFPYGIAKQRGNGEYPVLTTTGTPSVSGGGFTFEITGAAPNQIAVLFEGVGTMDLTWLGGRLVVLPPLIRLATVFIDGSGNLSIPHTVLPADVGKTKTYQLIYRDGSTPIQAGLSAGLTVTYCD
tara:strand:- start:5017 stop:7095 length:2079 start_codon:yes stop_codon:yes gene_type:complete